MHPDAVQAHTLLCFVGKRAQVADSFDCIVLPLSCMLQYAMQSGTWTAVGESTELWLHRFGLRCWAIVCSIDQQQTMLWV